MFLIQYYPQVVHIQLQVQVQVQPAAYNKSYDKSSELILSKQIIFILPPLQTYSININLHCVVKPIFLHRVNLMMPLVGKITLWV